jgi:hypothetical protein
VVELRVDALGFLEIVLDLGELEYGIVSCSFEVHVVLSF